MKKLLLHITFSLLYLFSFTQINVQQDQRVNQILKSALASKSGYYIYGRTSVSRFINIAVLNQASHTLCWFTCHGRLFDSTKLTTREFDQVTSKQLDPFTLYQNICDSYLAEMATGRDLYRIYGDKQSFDRLNSRYRALFAMETVQSAKTSLQKLIAIENAGKKILTQLAYLNCVNPSTLSHDPLYATNKEQAGIMVKTTDSTVYYNIDPTSAVAKITLYKKAPWQFYIQNRSSEIIDSVAIQPEKYDLLQKEKTDVFLLYRGWLEMQWQGTLSAIRRQSAGLYDQVNLQNEKEVKELYNQLNAIRAKINQLNSPEAKSIEQAVYDAYKNETTEIGYIPLLGIGYSLIQPRGAKEYELTNHLGNVLVTVSDKKIGVSSVYNSSLIDHYEPDVISAQDYYPFGMLQPGRFYLSATGNNYRYGFNGKENDDDEKGRGNSIDFGDRIYDPRLGRWLSLDPLMAKYPGMSPYNFTANNPLLYTDGDGKDFGVYVDHSSHTIIIKATYYATKGAGVENAQAAVSRWKAQNGKYQYVVKEGDKTETYKIRFELTVKPYENDAARDKAFNADKSGEGNKFATGPENFDTWGRTIPENGGGVNSITVENSAAAKARFTPAHEVGHTLGLEHWYTGLMKNGSDRDEGENNNQITIGNVSRILNFSGLGTLIKKYPDQEWDQKETDDIATVKVHEEGTAPENFKTGKVEEVPKPKR
ncbi:RHS repeat-associated protein [Chitinophagaceae bacterium OAS944]|uniref:RHS repeat domain-containing protein n=2 Tax=Niastella sp. OAS944 TaxID=2664089 RepID=UPI0035C82AF3|nr:RHS repeat-associated protein [Chitinophagaceae bacterium OAS944]